MLSRRLVCRARASGASDSNNYRKRYFQAKVRELERTLVTSPRELHKFDLQRTLREKWGDDTCIAFERYRGRTYLKVFRTIEDCTKECEEISDDLGEYIKKLVRAHPCDTLDRGVIIYIAL
jgi:hypothetical protein